MSVRAPDHDSDEIFFDLLKDEFVFFYALSVAVMDMVKTMSDDTSAPDETPRH